MTLKNIFSHFLSHTSPVETVQQAVSETILNNPIEKTIVTSKEINMSFISSFKTHFEDIENLFKKLFKSEPSWAQVAETDIAFVSPILESIVTSVGGTSVDAEVNAAVAVIQNGLVLATKFIQAEDASTNLSDALNALKTNLGALLSLAAIKNSTKVATITNYVDLFIGELNAIIAVLPKVVTAVPVA